MTHSISPSSSASSTQRSPRTAPTSMSPPARFSKWIDWRQGNAHLTAAPTVSSADSTSPSPPSPRSIPTCASSPKSATAITSPPVNRSPSLVDNSTRSSAPSAPPSIGSSASAAPRPSQPRPSPPPAPALDPRHPQDHPRPQGRRALRRPLRGGLNHRDSLAAGVLIKDNHIAAVRQAGGTLAAAVSAAVSTVGPATGVEVEVTTSTKPGKRSTPEPPPSFSTTSPSTTCPPPSRSLVSTTPKPRPAAASPSIKSPPSPEPGRLHLPRSPHPLRPFTRHRPGHRPRPHRTDDAHTRFNSLA